MKTNRFAGLVRAVVTGCVVAAGSSGVLYADDTEIYQASYTAEATGRPKVLIIFDDSGSMRTNVTSQKPAYTPNPAVPYVQRHDSDRIYWSTNGSPPSSNTSQYFTKSKNRCEESFVPLATVGYFQGKARRWRQTYSSVYRAPNALVYDAYWTSLSTRDRNPVHVDCEADVTNNKAGNGSHRDGFPYLEPFVVKPNYNQYRTPGAEYTSPPQDVTDSNVDWGSTAYTFYSAHYMDYWYDSSLTTTRTRLDIAQEVVSNLIVGNPGIDFGLVSFNYNSSLSNSGGRIVKRVLDSNDPNEIVAYRASLVTAVNATVANGWTPLCESTYEAFNYLAGRPLEFALPYGSTRDKLAETSLTSNVYDSPADSCAYTYVILMTDGLPTYDTHANARIQAMLNADTDYDGDKTCERYRDDHGNTSTSVNCLPQLAEYMANTDLDHDTTNGDQYAITYTIGFTTDQALLSDTATAGKGAYYTADSVTELTEAFRGAITSILSTDATFTSPSVAVDSFNRTQSRNEVFFAMFKPTETTDWRGNIKKLKLDITDGLASLVDKNGDPAINPSNGQIAADADTFWSVDDGGAVEEGGVGAQLVSLGAGNRTLWTNTGGPNPVDVLESFDSANIDAEAYGFDVTDPNDPNAALFDFWGVTSQAELDSLINWGKGYDINPDGTTNGTREWILGDMLHSKPLVVNYGLVGNFNDPNNPDQRILVGTNGGFLHMFDNQYGQETWAFFPKELGHMLKRRADNNTVAEHVYGVDASPVLYSQDNNLDGTIDASNPENDKAWIFFGLRRGGSLMYGLDISDPNDPEYMWKIDPNDPGYADLGQTWSEPVVTYIPGYTDADGPKPVLVFGGGYDTNKDASGLGTPDIVGNGLYIADAATGDLVWSVTSAVDSATNMQETGLLHSVPGNVTVLDSNGDELTDRIYFADTGGNVWRVDLPGNTRPDSGQDTWFIVKLAAVNGGTDATDRRFFNAPDVVRTIFKGQNIDAVLLGSGDRTNPNATDVDNEFYMIRDEQVTPYFTPVPTDCTDPDFASDNRCAMGVDGLPLVVAGDPNDFYDVSANLIQNGTADERDAALVSLSNASGWRLPLTADGEKSLARAITISGKTYFTTFSPDLVNTNVCKPAPGTGRLYIVDLLTAAEEVDFNDDGSTERSWIIGELIPDTPAPHFGSDGEIRLLLPPGSGGDGFTDNPFETGSSIPAPYGSYWYREEY